MVTFGRHNWGLLKLSSICLHITFKVSTVSIYITFISRIFKSSEMASARVGCEMGKMVAV